jgi:alpha-mannosidase
VTSGIHHLTFITIYADIDRVDFDFRIDKPVTTREQRLCHVFPVLQPEAVLRAETTGVVIRPYPQPKGDLLPGADTKRFAIQGFVDASTAGGLGVTIVPVEAFVLRLDLDPLTFEALGNDQNYQESTRDQNAETQFRFRYSLRAHSSGWQGALAANFSRSVTSPLIVASGAISPREIKAPTVAADRALVTAFKPADDAKAGGHILRLWERAGAAGPLKIAVPGYRRAVETDLLERDKAELPISNGEVAIQLAAHGFACLRLFPA